MNNERRISMSQIQEQRHVYYDHDLDIEAGIFGAKERNMICRWVI